MAITLFSTDFTGATDPSLTPVPWTSVSVSAGNTLAYNASNPLASGPCQASTFGGTSAGNNGIYTLPTLYMPMYRQCTLSADAGFPVVPFPAVSGSSIGVLRLRSATTAICTIEMFANAVGDPRWRIRANDSTTAVGTTMLAAATMYNIRMLVDARDPVNVSFTLFVNGVQEAQLTGKTLVAADGIDSVRAGGIGVSGNPSAGIVLYMDNISFQVPSSAGGAVVGTIIGKQIGGIGRAISLAGFCSMALIAMFGAVV